MNRIGKWMKNQENDPLVVDEARAISLCVYDRGFDSRSERLPIRLLPNVTIVNYDGPDGNPTCVSGDLATIARTLEANGYGPVVWKTKHAFLEEPS